MRSVATAALALAVISLHASAAQQRAPQRATPRPPSSGRAVVRTESAVPFKVGETLSYDVSWSQIVTAGSATATVVEKKPSLNSTAYAIVVEGRPVPLVAKLYPLYYKIDTLIDAYGLLAQQAGMYSEEKAGKRTASTRFDRAGRKASFEVRSETTTAAAIDMPPLTQDGLAALYALRAQTIRTGDHITVPVTDGGIIYSSQVDVGPIERVKSVLGELDAWNIRVAVLDPAGQPVWKNVNMWMSTDARRIPLKMQAELPVGHFVLSLTGAK